MTTLAAAQAASRAGDIAANVQTAAELVREAAGLGASVVVFPELFLCGYDLERIRREPERCDLRLEDPRLAALTDACRESRIHAVMGASVAEPGGRRLAALIVDARGAVRDRYAKRHLWGPERDLFVPGDAACAFEVDGRRLAIGICVEATLPEHARAAARDGALAYLTPSADTDAAVGVAHAARARENGMYVVYANHVGGEFSGHSAIFGPTGDCVAELDGIEEGLAVAELRPFAAARARERMPCGNW
jgi:predicted amidohydrolase